MTASETPAHVEDDDVLLRAARYGLFAVLLLSSLLVVRIGEYTAGDIVLAATVGVVLFAIAAHHTRRRGRRLPVLALVIFAALVGGGALSGLRALSVASTLAVVARLVLVVLILPWVARAVLPTAAHLRSAMTAFAIGCGICGGGTLLQFVFGATVIPGTGVTDAGRFAGFTQNVSDTGGVGCAGVVLSLALLVTSHGRGKAIPLLAAAGSGLGLILSGSVSGLLSTAVGAAVLLITGVLRPWAAAGALAAASAFLAIIVAIQTAVGALNPIQRILQTTGQSADARYDTAGSRVSTYTEALRKITEHPFVGAGLDPTSTIVDGIYPAHNLFIAAMYCGGVLLLVGVVLAVVRPALLGALHRRREPLVAVSLALVLTELVFAMTAPSLYNRYLWIPFALLITALAVRHPPVARTVPLSAPVVEVRRVTSIDAFARAGDPARRRPEARHAGW